MARLTAWLGLLQWLLRRNKLNFNAIVQRLSRPDLRGNKEFMCQKHSGLAGEELLWPYFAEVRA